MNPFSDGFFLKGSTAFGLKDTKVCPLFTLPAMHGCPVTSGISHCPITREGKEKTGKTLFPQSGTRSPAWELTHAG